MCGIFTCLSIVPWILDLVQRILTLGLAMFIGLVVCVSFLIAVSAGVAYGYNYSMSEFLSLSRNDVSVYIKRGQGSISSNLKPNSKSSELGQLPHWSVPQQAPVISITKKLRDSQDFSNYAQKQDDSPRAYERLSKESNRLFKPKKTGLEEQNNDMLNQDELTIENAVQEIVKKYHEKKQSSKKPLEEFIRFIIQTSAAESKFQPSRTSTTQNVAYASQVNQNLLEEKPSTEGFIQFVTTYNLEEYSKKQTKEPSEVQDISKIYQSDDMFWINDDDDQLSMFSTTS